MICALLQVYVLLKLKLTLYWVEREETDRISATLEEISRKEKLVNLLFTFIVVGLPAAVSLEFVFVSSDRTVADEWTFYSYQLTTVAVLTLVGLGYCTRTVILLMTKLFG